MTVSESGGGRRGAGQRKQPKFERCVKAIVQPSARFVAGALLAACASEPDGGVNEGPRIDALEAPTTVPRDVEGRHVWVGVLTFFDKEQDVLRTLKAELRGSEANIETRSTFSEPSSWSGQAEFRIVLPPSLGPGAVEATLRLVDARGAEGPIVGATLVRQ